MVISRFVTTASRRCYVFIVLLSPLSLLVHTDAAQQCERLKATLTYTQEEAPRDLSGVVRLCSVGCAFVLHATRFAFLRALSL